MEVDDSCHNWRVPSKWKGYKGEQGESARGAKEKCAMYTCNCNVYAKE
jgi:hypothetical protein